MKKVEYRIMSSRSDGINESYYNLRQFKDRFYDIVINFKDYKDNSMIYFYKNIYNKEGKITKWETLHVLDLRNK